MPIGFMPRMASCLAVFFVVCATTVRADSLYQPYYTQDTRDSYLYATVTPPQPAVAQTTQPMLAPDNQPEDIFFHYNNEIWGAAGTSFLNYKEAVTPIPDSERGFLPSLAGGVNYMTHSKLFLSVDGSVDFGNAHYQGAYFAEPNTPVATTGTETIANADGKIGQGFALNSSIMLMPYVDIGFRYWHRDLGDDQIEKYDNFDALGGLMVEIAPTNRLMLTLYGSGGTTFASQMSTGGNNYKLGGSGMEKAGAKLGYEVVQRVEVFTTFDYDHFHFGQSGANNGILEPGSRTSDMTMRVGVGYHFR